mgnify:FL=1
MDDVVFVIIFTCAKQTLLYTSVALSVIKVKERLTNVGIGKPDA